MRLISSANPCRISRAKPTGISKRTGQRIKPPGLGEPSPVVQAFMNTGQDR